MSGIAPSPTQKTPPPPAFATGPSRSALVRTSANSMGLSGPAAASAEGLAVTAVHRRGAAVGAGLDLTDPAAPARRLAGLAGARQLLGHRMAAAELGQLRLEALFVDIPGGLGRQDLAQWRAIEAHRRA